MNQNRSKAPQITAHKCAIAEQAKKEMVSVAKLTGKSLSRK